ncbi:hypothetical protein PV08_08508 [Exophiala spinifera]|uniref:NAD(P)-binding protein n=1 Tax=Exophiala spinifera TaxID=91928 RepID=A0A0D2B3R0_9EURO|nr:uncharacterized protein PV08_08508 [Exophiala spinifera]KIW13320.1 hypothetical protein PV08_08508 [Exophiala spinifera]
MSSFAVTGASRGIGFEFIKQFSADPANTVVGLVRDVKATEAKVKAELSGRSNVHILHGDLDSYESLKKASEDTAKITGGGLDYLIHNGARLSDDSAFFNFTQLGENPEALEHEILAGCKSNVVGSVHLFNLFVPLILEGKKKKVIAISSGHADLDLITKYDVDTAPTYAVDKAALNTIVAKYSAQFRKDGVLFLSISPGVVDTGRLDPSKLSEKQLPGFAATIAKFQAYAPHFKEKQTTEQAVKAVISVFEKASVENGDGGAFVSHLGSKQWI